MSSNQLQCTLLLITFGMPFEKIKTPTSCYRRSVVDDEIRRHSFVLLSLAKRGRKYYLGLATITQDVDDFMKSPYGLPIITNSSIQLLLKQSPTSIDRLQQTFNLTEEEKYLLLESG